MDISQVKHEDDFRRCFYPTLDLVKRKLNLTKVTHYNQTKNNPITEIDLNLGFNFSFKNSDYTFVMRKGSGELSICARRVSTVHEEGIDFQVEEYEVEQDGSVKWVNNSELKFVKVSNEVFHNEVRSLRKHSLVKSNGGEDLILLIFEIEGFTNSSYASNNIENVKIVLKTKCELFKDGICQLSKFKLAK